MHAGIRNAATVIAVTWASVAGAQVRYSTGAVNNYPAATCGGPSLSHDIAEGRDFQVWYNLAGHRVVSRWEDGDVWGSDFRDASTGSNPNDREPSGGSDIAQVYFFSGHGICENPPTANSGDFLVTCGNFGKPDVSRIQTSSRWGNAGGTLQFMFIDASCPMDLASITSEWWIPFQGLHVATGNSGDVTHDTLDSESRGSQFAVYTVGESITLFGIRFTLVPQLSVGDAWMNTGLIDVQDQVCAVVIAAGNTEQDAINRRENELVTSMWANPSPVWFAWKWVCK
jgi:hypothetical protein